MDGKKTLARPYANAVFELALKENSLGFWSGALRVLANIADDSAIKKIYTDPRFTPEELGEIFIFGLEKAGQLTESTEQLIKLLAHYRRLPALPMIQMLFEEQKAIREETLEVTVVTAFMLSAALQEKLKQALSARFKKAVILSCSEDRALVGGAFISAGSLIIDYSAKRMLSQLKQSLISE